VTKPCSTSSLNMQFLVSAASPTDFVCSHVHKVHNSSTKNPRDMAETPTNHLLCVLDLRHQSIRKNHSTLAIRNFTYRHPVLVVLPSQANQSGFDCLFWVSQRAHPHCQFDIGPKGHAQVTVSGCHLCMFFGPISNRSLYQAQCYKRAASFADKSQTLGLSTWPSV